MIFYKIFLVTLYFAVVLVFFRLHLLFGASLGEFGEAALCSVQKAFPCSFGWLCCRFALRIGLGSRSNCCKDRTDKERKTDGSFPSVSHDSRMQQASGFEVEGEGHGCPEALEFSAFEHFVENVEDTKACVWVVIVIPRGKRYSKRSGSAKDVARAEVVFSQWKNLCRKMQHVGIRLGSYDCGKDSTLCRRNAISDISLLLTMPKDIKPKGKVATYLYPNFGSDNMNASSKAEEWITSVLDSRVKSMNVKEPIEDTLQKLTDASFAQRNSLGPSARLAFSSQHHQATPLLLSVLSVKFTGRVDFFHLRSTQSDISSTTGEEHDAAGFSRLWLLPMQPNSTKRAVDSRRHYEYHYLDIFLRTIHPETNDLFLVAIFLINLACLLDVFLRDGGPLKRLVYSLWVTSCANTVLIFIWLPLLKLCFLPQMLPVIKAALTVFQNIMISEFASSIRQDLTEVFGHLSSLLTGFLVYCFCIAYLKYRAYYNSSGRTASWSDLMANDLHDIKQIVAPLFYMTSSPHDLDYGGMEEGLDILIRYLAVPTLWLRSMEPLDYLKNTHSVIFCGKIVDQEFACLCEAVDRRLNQQVAADCAICLESYQCGNELTLLPCSHSFHKGCVASWVCSSSKHRCRTCPTCRWPIYRPKTCASAVALSIGDQTRT